MECDGIMTKIICDFIDNEYNMDSGTRPGPCKKNACIYYFVAEDQLINGELVKGYFARCLDHKMIKLRIRAELDLTIVSKNEYITSKIMDQ